MEIKDLEIKTKKDFNNAISLMAIIPLLVFLYLLVARIASFSILAGEIGYVMMAVMLVVLVGIYVGKQSLWLVLAKLFDFNRKILNMQEELIEKNRLAAITDTVLTLGHEINNPLLIMQGNLELLESDLAINQNHTEAKERVGKIKNSCERIMQVTEKLTSLSKPTFTSVHGDIKIIDLKESK